MTLAVEQARAFWDYEKETGILRWRVYRSPRAIKGSVAGYCFQNGYWTIQFGGKKYSAHRLAWLIVTGRWPTLLDHINGIKTDNRWCNLREATPSQNNYNTKRLSTNSTGFKGVYPFRGRFGATIKVNRKSIFLGLFDKPEDAHAAYVAAAKKYVGEFMRAA